MNRELIDLIISRRSVRSFKPDMPPQEVIDEIISAGTYAALGKNTQSPIIIAVTNKELIAKLSKINARIMGTTNDPFYGAPVILIVLIEIGRASCRERV